MRRNKVTPYIYNLLLMFAIATELFNLFNPEIVLTIIKSPNVYPNIVLSLYNFLYLIFVFVLMFSKYKKIGFGLVFLSILSDIFIKNYTIGILRIDSILCLVLLLIIVWDKTFKLYKSIQTN